ncbi:MAG: hypothetical protein U1F11_06465 [Steroidobacteraceae bacterium]
MLEPVSEIGIVWPWRLRASVSCVSFAACSRSKLARSLSSRIDSTLRPVSCSSDWPSSRQAARFATLITPSGEVTNTASVMLPSTLLR